MSFRGADLQGPEREHQLPLLDTPLDGLNVHECCHDCAEELLPDVDDNPRLPCRLEVHHKKQKQTDDGEKIFRSVKLPKDLFDTAVHTARQVLEHNKPRPATPTARPVKVDDCWHLSVRCQRCDQELCHISARDTKEKLYLDLHHYITHDRSLPLKFDPSKAQAALPADAVQVC
eukprot:5178218-Amphidinium_carterae.1